MSQTIDDRRQQWLESRRTSIGASESPAILGYGYASQSAYSVWVSKVYPDADDDLEDVERLVLGRMLEPALRDLFRWRTGLAVEPVDYDSCVHPDYPWLSATPDGYVTDGDQRGVLELKNVGHYFAAEWADGVPLQYQIQVQHQLAVTGRSFGYAMALAGGQKLHVHRIERDDEFIAALIARLAEFWECVVRKTPPPIDGSAATTAALKRLHPDDNGETITLPDNADELIERRAAIKSELKSLAQQEAVLDNQLREWIGANTFGVTTGGVTLSLKTCARAGYEVKPTSYRTLRVHK